jgi:predicted Zn finger-like uncharacterized protein
MNVQCTHCNTVFRVDPAKVPAAGLRARCSVCRGVFEVASPAGAAVPEPVGAAVAAAAPAAPAMEAPVAAPAPQPVAAPAPAPASPPRPSPVAAPAARPAAIPGRPPAPSPFGSSDPNAKARRLARALVSDIVTYHPERRDRALADGSLKREFMEEIKKSWEEYVGQVGAETARSTPHFRDALNDILAKGQQVF